MKHILSIIFYCFVCFYSMCANEVNLDSSSATFANSEISLKVETFTPTIIKFSFRTIDDTAKVISYTSVINAKNNIYSFDEDQDNYYVRTDSLLVKVLKSNLSPLVFYNNEIICDTITYIKRETHQVITYNLDSSELFYGFGSHALPVERSKIDFTLYNSAKFGYQNDVMNLSAGVPLFISSKMYAVFGDNYGQIIAGMKSLGTNLFKYIVFTGKMDFFVIKGNTYSEILKNYCYLTGYQDLPPLWAFGYLQSRSSYNTKAEVDDIVKKFKIADFPIDAVILDLSWFFKDKKLGDYHWLTDNWGNPEDYVSELNKQGIKTVLITEPYISQTADNYQIAKDIGLFTTDSSGELPIMTVLHSETSLLDFTNKKTQAWFWHNLKDIIITDKIDGWWCDLGEPEIHPFECIHKLGSAYEIHNIFSVLWGKSLYENWKTDLPDKRPFLLFRAGWAGMQKYSMIPWSGDIYRSYSALQAQIPINLGMGMSGVGYMHSDCGGFYGPNTDEQLYTRWIEYSSFSPILRVHFVGNVNNEPVNFSNQIQSICKKYVKLRYSLLPYIYTLAYENASSGVPICRLMNFYDNDLRLSNENGQYFFGKDIIVAPVVDSTFSKKVKFPEGLWFDYHTLDLYRGYSENEFNVPLETLPLFIRAGAIIPSTDPIANTSEYKTDTLTLNYYFCPEISNSYAKVFIDDGKNPNSLKNKEYEILNATADYKDSLITISINRELNNWTKFDTLRVYKINILNKDLINADAIQNNFSDSIQNLIVKPIYQKGLSIVSTESTDSIQFIIRLNTNPSIVNSDTNTINLFPNPVSNIVNLQMFSKDFFNYSIDLYDVSGKLITHYEDINLSVGEITISLNIKNINEKALNKGMYLLKFNSEKISKNLNFIVN